MNISTEAWIPIVWADGKPGTVSLCEAFERGENIRDIAVRPHERIAVMRLLICIAQVALDGPADKDDWKACHSKIAPAALDYFRRWHKAFELLGDGPRFLQVEGLKKPAVKDNDEEGNSVSKLDLALATGNNSTLFDNGGGSDREFLPAHLALMLLTFQCFSPGGTIGVALWNGLPTLGWSSYPAVKPGQSNHAPCLPRSMLHSFLRGDTLADSVHLNLLGKYVVESAFGQKKWGLPVWECLPKSPDDKTAIANATDTYLGRLVPISRAVRLENDGRSMLLANALTYPAYPEAREPSSTIIIRNEDGQPTRAILGGSLGRAPWRELHSLTVKRIGSDTPGGPLALENLEPASSADLWIGALVTDKKKAALILDTVEAVFHIPAAMLDADRNSQRVYEEGVKHSERAEYRLYKAISTYRLAMETSEADLDGIYRRLASLKKTERDRLRSLSAKATAQFWTDIEQAVSQLLDLAADPTQLGAKNEWHNTDWGKAVWAAMRAAYEHACPHDTPRQMRAYALGMNTLHFTPKTEEETEA